MYFSILNCIEISCSHLRPKYKSTNPDYHLLRLSKSNRVHGCVWYTSSIYYSNKLFTSMVVQFVWLNHKDAGHSYPHFLEHEHVFLVVMVGVASHVSVRFISDPVRVVMCEVIPDVFTFSYRNGLFYKHCFGRVCFSQYSTMKLVSWYIWSIWSFYNCPSLYDIT